MTRSLLCSRMLRALQVVLVLAVGSSPRAARAFHFPWDQGHDTTDWDDPPGPGPCTGPLCTPCNSTGSPVYVPTGHFLWRETDLRIAGRHPIALSRAYNSHDPRDGIFGNGWSSGCDPSVLRTVGTELDGAGSPVAVTKYVVRLEDGKRYEFRQVGAGPIEAPAGRHDQLVVNADGTIEVVTDTLDRAVYSANGKLLRSVDRNGSALVYGYDAAERLVRLSDGNGRTIELAYDSRGRVQAAVDFTGRTWTYGYDAAGNLVSVTNPLGGVRRYEYQPYTPAGDGFTYQHLTRVTDESGIVLTTVTYTNERVTRFTELQNTFTLSYSPSTKTTQKTDALGSTWQFVYDDDQQIVREVDPLGRAIASQYDAEGNLVSMVDQEGATWSATYDGLGRVLTETDPLGHAVGYEYLDRNPWPVRLTTPSGRVTTLTRDAAGNLLTYADPSGATVTNAYTADGILRSTTDPEGNVVTFQADAYGRRIATTDPLGRVTRTSYDELSRVTAEIDAAGNAKTHTYDALDRLVSTTERSGATTTYAYDAAGRLLSATDPQGQVTRYTYDSFGRLGSRAGPGGQTTSYEYGADNRLVRVVQPDGAAVAFGYDASKRLTRRATVEETATYGYDGRGALVRAENGTGVLTRQLDRAGHLVAETFLGQTVTFSLNVEGEREQLQALGGVTTYQRDGRGLLTRIVDPTGTYQFSYTATGLRSGLTFPNGVAVTSARNADQQVVDMTYAGAFTDARRFSYDGRGYVAQQTVNGVARTYSYDPQGRLLSAVHPDQTYTFAYDDRGNVVAAGRVYDASNRLTEDAERIYRHDARGNLTEKVEKASGARVAYVWNSQNQLVRVSRYGAGATTPSEVVEYRYDPLGRRSSKSVNGSTEQYVHDGFNRIGTLDSAGNVVVRAVFGPGTDEPLGMSTPAGIRFFHADALGSVVALTDAAGVRARYSYSPYGSLEAPPAEETPFGFTGREMDAPDLYYYRSRYYDPKTQRFLSEDPLGVADGTSLYAYVEGNPISNTDPLGLQPGSPDWCRRQLERIRNIEQKIRERIGELDEDPLNLPEACPGDDKKPSLSRRGHRKLINMDKANLAAQQALYQAYCGNNPPPPPVPVPSPAPTPAPAPSPNGNPYSNPSWNIDWGAVAVGVGVVIVVGAAIYFSGGLAAPALASDRTQKTDLEPVNAEEILEKVARLDVSTWQYQGEKDARHMGPMAQDFRAAFGLGSSDKVINTVDALGVLYASVHALSRKLEAQEQELQRLRKVEERLVEQATTIERLRAALQAGGRPPPEPRKEAQ